MNWLITPIKTGAIKCNKGLTITLGVDVGKIIDIPSVSWLLDNRADKILVDTGMCDTETANKYHYPGSNQNPEERIDNALKKLGIKLTEIKKIIFTHLHWDHCQNAALFQNAEYIVQEKELVFAKNPLPPYYNSYDAKILGRLPAFDNLKFKTISKDIEILDGINTITTPGHSPGHQSVLVNTVKGKYLIAGDAVLSYENWNGNKEKKLDFIMNGRYMDLEKTWKSFEKMKKTGAKMLPGHDFEVFKKKQYP